MASSEQPHGAPDEYWVELRDDHYDKLWARLEVTHWWLEVRRGDRVARFDLRIYLLRR
jgi:hypothetical protein